MGHGVPAGEVEAAVYLGGVAPVDAVEAFKDLHAEEVEVAGYHVVAVVDADNVGVGEIGAEDGVAVRAVALVAPCSQRGGSGGRGGGKTTADNGRGDGGRALRREGWERQRWRGGRRGDGGRALRGEHWQNQC